MSCNSDSLSISELDLLNERKYEDLNRHARIRASAASIIAWKLARHGIYCASDPAYHRCSDPLAPPLHFSSETSRETPTKLLTEIPASQVLIDTRRLLLAFRAWIRANRKQFIAICIGVILFALACATPATLGAIGFSATGPLAKSFAAAWQASIGCVAPGSLFAFLQSATMGGSIWWLNMIKYVGFLIAVAGILGTVDLREKVAEIGEIICENSVNAGEVIKNRAVAVVGAMAIGTIKVGMKVEGWLGKMKGKMKGE